MSSNRKSSDVFFGVIGVVIGVFLCIWAVEKQPNIHLLGKVLLFVGLPCLTGFLGYRCKSIRYLSW